VFVIEVAGRRRNVTADWVDDCTLLVSDGRGTTELRFDAGEIECGRRRYRVETAAAGASARAEAARALGAAGGRLVVKAPMPGRVVRVLVSAGDRVSARQPLLVVEAMKMENILRAPRAGVVTDVAAAAGLAVETGAALVVIDG
jgi:biotin carboxyl carrier protein